MKYFGGIRMNRGFFRIFVAVLLRDIRTRFGRTYLSFFISIAWPLTHISAICFIYYLTNKVAPIGDDPGVFATTGVAPYIFCLYPARFTAFAIVQNKSLLQFSIVKPIHLMMARAFLEILSASIVFFIFSTSLYLMGIAIIPIDKQAAFFVVFVTVFLGVGIGFFGVSICAFQPLFGTLIIVFFILGMYFTSGAFIAVSNFGKSIESAIYYNPLFHSVRLLRGAFFDVYEGEDGRISYIALIGAIFFFLGLLGERVFRGRIMS